MGKSRYADWPEHPLRDVPQEVLDAARAQMAEVALYKDVDPDFAEPIADSIVCSLLPWLKF